MLTALLVTVAGFAHGLLLVMVTATESPFARVGDVNDEDAWEGIFTPFIFHW